MASMSDDALRVPAPDGPASSMYSEYYYKHDFGVPYERDEHWMNFFAGIAKRIVRDLSPHTALDAGCAMGLLVEQLVERGVDAYGVDISDFAISRAPDLVRDHCRVHSLTEPIDGRFDLVVCIEVLEHLAREDADKAMDNLCAASDTILFSSSPLDYAEATHVNVHPPEVWSEMFSRRGFYRDVDFDATFLTPWAALYRKVDVQAPELVRSYERVLWQLRNEVSQVRTLVLSMQSDREQRLLEGTDAIEGAEYRRLQQELQETRAAMLSTRDMVAGLEAALGEALGERERFERHAISREQAVSDLEALRGSKAVQSLNAGLRPYRRFVDSLRRLRG
jgi:hypothetical protein